MYEEYNNMTEQEQKEFLAELIHAVQHFPTAFRIGRECIVLSKKFGIFKDAKIGVSQTNPFDLNDIKQFHNNIPY